MATERVPICVLKSRRFPDNPRDARDGGTLNVLHVISVLHKHGWPIHVYTRREHGEGEVTEHAGMTVFRVGYQASREANIFLRDREEGQSFVESAVAHRVFRSMEYTHIHTHHWTSTIGLESEIKPSVRLVHTPHLLAREKARALGTELPWVVAQAEQAILERADVVIAVSEQERAAVLERHPGMLAKVLVIPNGVSPAFFDVKPLQELDGLQITTVARLCRQKGIEILLDAADRLFRSGADLAVTIVGDSYAEPDYEAQIRSRAQEWPLAGKVRFFGWIPHDQIPQVLAHTSIYVQSSFYESQCVAILEAMAAARPVVASNLPAIGSFLRHRVSGMLVKPGDASALAEALAEVHADAKLRRLLAYEGRSVASRFSWDKCEKATLEAVLGPIAAHLR